MPQGNYAGEFGRSAGSGSRHPEFAEGKPGIDLHDFIQRHAAAGLEPARNVRSLGNKAIDVEARVHDISQACTPGLLDQVLQQQLILVTLGDHHVPRLFGKGPQFRVANEDFLRTLGMEPQVGRKCRAEPGDSIAVEVDRQPHGSHQVIHDAAHDLEQQVLLAVDVVVQAPHPKAGRGGNLTQAGGVIPALEKQLGGLGPNYFGAAPLHKLRHSCHLFRDAPVFHLSTTCCYGGGQAGAHVDFPAITSFTESCTYERSYSFDPRCVLFDQLFQPMDLGGQTLPNRLVLPPLTRSRAGKDGVPTPLMAEYYRQRSGAGLVISEGTVVSPQGASYARVPGLYSEQQVRGWRPVVEAAKSRGAAVYAQLWHVGRQAHSSVQPDGGRPWAPSAIAITGWQYRSPQGRVPFEEPRELSLDGIKDIVEQFAVAARNAMAAGFDGVELHVANGYLFDQFLNSSSNQRTDQYGGSVENRLRFLNEVIDAVSSFVPAHRIGVRISPSSTWMDAFDPDKRGLYSALVRSISPRGLAYLHLVEPGIAGAIDSADHAEPITSAELGALFDGPVIVTGGHTPWSAAAAVGAGDADLVGFGRLFISNPDLPTRIRMGAGLAELRHEGLYGGGATGYTDYPELQTAN